MTGIEIKVLEMVSLVPKEVWIVLGIIFVVSIIVSIIKKAVKLAVVLLVISFIFGSGGVYVEKIKDNLVNLPIDSITEGVSEEMQNKMQELKDKFTVEVNENIEQGAE